MLNFCNSNGIETGKTLENAIDELREVVDFCCYYSTQAKREFFDPKFYQG